MTAASETAAGSAKEFPAPTLFHRTSHGEIWHGDSLGLLHRTLKPGSVDLIMTSPPFALVRKKSYGNVDADQYLTWFRDFAEGFKRVLKPKGSLVIDIGGSWRAGTPTRSLYHFELLLMLCREYGFHLCQEFYWWNPAKLPSPAEWVNIRRIRVKDALNNIWWLSPTPWPKASNLRVLAPYSDSMLDLLKDGYRPKLRPSGHEISEKFSENNGGAVPPNLLAQANTESNGNYQTFCRENKLPVHPARFPAQIPEFFIRFLTDRGDLVVDPFAGSCVAGEAAEGLGRKWVCCEQYRPYLEGGLSRFRERPPAGKGSIRPYMIHSPRALVTNDHMILPADGGQARPQRQRSNNEGLTVRMPPRHWLNSANGMQDQLWTAMRGDAGKDILHRIALLSIETKTAKYALARY